MAAVMSKMDIKRIYNISDPPTSIVHRSCIALLSDKELVEAKQERPDLIFSLVEDIPSEASSEEEINVVGHESVNSMALSAIRLKD